jgi:hypothetical protein
MQQFQSFSWQHASSSPCPVNSKGSLQPKSPTRARFDPTRSCVHSHEPHHQQPGASAIQILDPSSSPLRHPNSRTIISSAPPPSAAAVQHPHPPPRLAARWIAMRSTTGTPSGVPARSPPIPPPWISSARRLPFPASPRRLPPPAAVASLFNADPPEWRCWTSTPYPPTSIWGCPTASGSVLRRPERLGR